MKQLQTAEEFLNDIKNITYSQEEMMIEFAKLHVQAALESAAEKSKTRTNDESTSIIVDKESILNAYPLDNIK